MNFTVSKFFNCCLIWFYSTEGMSSLLHAFPLGLGFWDFWRHTLPVKMKVKEGFQHLGLVYVPCHHVTCSTHHQAHILPSHLFAADIPVESLLALHIPLPDSTRGDLGFLKPVPALIHCLYIPPRTHDLTFTSCIPPLFCLILVRSSLVIHATTTFP